jgi:hypothetical protein
MLHTTELSCLKVQIHIERPNRYKSSGTHQISADCSIQAGVVHYVLRSTNCDTSGRNQQIVRIYKKAEKTDCSNYRGTSVLPTRYKVLANILISSLNPYVEEIIGDHQCGFRRSRSTTYQIFCIRQILKKIWDYNKTEHRLSINYE